MDCRKEWTNDDEKIKKHRTMYKNNSGFSVKFKGSIFVQSLVIN